MESWRMQAKCKDQTELFYSEDLQKINQAKKICAECPVVHECREFVRSHLDDQHYGVWAGDYYWGGTLLKSPGCEIARHSSHRPLGRNGLPQYSVTLIEQLTDEGWSQRRIAHKLSISRRTVARYRMLRRQR